MGITKNCAKFLAYAASKGVSFQATLMLGRQTLYLSRKDAESALAKFAISHAGLTDKLNGEFAETLFRALGANEVESMDFSDFEKATMIHDLNTPIPGHLKERFSVVFDGGTLEHIFNFPVAIRNCMDMVRSGGHFLSITPCNNQCGHGFYQFSPELFFAIFNERNGFEMNMVMAGVELPKEGILEWYAITDPAKAKERVTLSNSLPTYLMVIARKIRSSEGISLQPMQSDYQRIWNVHNSIAENLPVTGENKWIHYYRRFVPEPVKRLIRKATSRGENMREHVPGLGKVVPEYFKKLDV